mmetsp:Transcript_12229/g.39147  ORF Transcript_12229/g.39147 Transcript_12229/m.39147 type:complete len:201 (+) Transcript_12229:2937-3539(+)
MAFSSSWPEPARTKASTPPGPDASEEYVPASNIATCGAPIRSSSLAASMGGASVPTKTALDSTDVSHTQVDPCGSQAGRRLPGGLAQTGAVPSPSRLHTRDTAEKCDWPLHTRSMTYLQLESRSHHRAASSKVAAHQFSAATLLSEYVKRLFSAGASSVYSGLSSPCTEQPPATVGYEPPSHRTRHTSPESTANRSDQRP